MTNARHIVCPHCAAVNRVGADRPAGAGRCGKCRGPLFDGRPLDVDEATLEGHLRGNDIPVLLDVWAPWCGPCRTMAPQFARAAAMLEPHVRLVKLNADSARATCARLGVRGIPALFLIHDGHVVAQTAGAMDADAIARWARGHLATTAT